ncbi:S-layer homology domain-containing protein [Paenibacillus ihumii]|uniref:S-layer homology domain-containing protein n=1 Tax=Paenibacillus ihumii TaxID=687436 RepID=UPI0006D7CBEE|nr:S-layer homology domain-containing protein [Paenibacillus ihumii]
MRKRVFLWLASFIVVMNVHFAAGVQAAGTGFQDVQPDHWASKAIESAVGKGYFKGYADGAFKPNATVTRAEFAALLARVSKAEADVTTHASFADLNGHWSESEVKRAVALGFVQPGDYPAGFKPDTPITRFEIAKWMASGLAEADPDYQQALEDTKTTVIPVKEYFNPGIPESKSAYLAVALGTKLLSGYPDGSFGMERQATRAETAAILLNFEDASSKKADEFLGLQELRQVGTERTNLETISPFTTGNTSFNHVVDKTYTFKNNAGTLKLHNYIVVDTEDFKEIKSIYAPLFVDESDYVERIDKVGTYSVFMQLTIYPKTKEFLLDHYMNGVNSTLLGSGGIRNQVLIQKYDYLTLPNMEVQEFFKKHNKGKGITLWIKSYITSDHKRSSFTTDDISVVVVQNQ